MTLAWTGSNFGSWDSSPPSLLLKGKQSETPPFPKSIIRERTNRCFGDTGVIKRKWQMVFSWASCSTDMILGKGLLGSKTQLANQFKSSLGLPAGLCCPLLISGLSAVSPLPKPKSNQVHLRFLCFPRTLDNQEGTGCPSGLIKD